MKYFTISLFTYTNFGLTNKNYNSYLAAKEWWYKKFSIFLLDRNIQKNCRELILAYNNICDLEGKCKWIFDNSLKNQIVLIEED